MHLNSLKIRNFRCFKNYEIEFAPRVTVLFGKNGTGKTTLIHAIHKALSFMMYSEPVKEKDAKNGKLKVVNTKSVVEGNTYLHVEGFSKQGDWFTTSDPLIEIAAEAELPAVFDNDEKIPLSWKISAYTHRTKLRPGEFLGAFRDFFSWFNYTGELPLLCYVSDSFPHKEDTHTKRVKKKVSKYRSYGYYNWNDESGNTKEWVARLENTIRELERTERRIRNLEEKGDKAETKTLYMANSIINISPEEQLHGEREYRRLLVNEVRVIEKALCDFSSKLEIDGKRYMDVASIGLHPDDDRLCLRLSNGELKSFRHLPAGYKRLYGIVLGIAYRSLLLNPELGASSRGIAIIDEIDLHLHPELEKIALVAVVDTFPSLQFIVSTHSPMVLSGLKTTTGENKILRLSLGEESPLQIPDVYGLDYNSIVQEIMNVGASDPELQRLIDRCAYLYKSGYEDRANTLRAQLVERNMIGPATLQSRIEKAMEDLE